MRLTRLEIFGFKSFVERFTLNFDQNLIGIVGPNGCGKSNVVDALRWVLGETHAKQLRGGKQEDLIFNGSEARRPLGMAEVSITIRPDQHWAQNAFNQQDELERLLEESALVEYELPLGEQSGEVEHKVVAEHSLEAEPVSEPVDLNTSERKGKAAESVQGALGNSFLAELPGLLNSSEIQFTRRLYRSGESEYMINRIPCRLRDMVEIYRFIGLGSRGLNIVQQGQIGELISKKPIERRELLEEAAGISGFRTKLEAAQRKLAKTNENLSRIRDIEIEVEKQVRVLKRQAARAKVRNELKAELEQLELEWFKLRALAVQSRKEAAEKELAEREISAQAAEVAFREAESRYVESQAELEGQDQKIFELRRERDGWTGKLRAERDRIQNLEKELVRCDAELEALHAQRIQLGEREERLAEENTRREQELSSFLNEQHEAEQLKLEAENRLEARRIEVAEELNEIEQAIAQKLSESKAETPAQDIESIQRDIQQTEQELQVVASSDIDSKTRELRREISQLRSRIQNVVVQEASLEAEKTTIEKQVATLAAHVVEATSADAIGQDLKTLASGLVVSESMQLALQAALGDKGSFVVSSSASELGTQFASRVDQKKRVRLGVIDAHPVLSAVAQLTTEELAVAPSARMLLDAIQVKPEFSEACRVLLGHVILVDTLDEALTLQTMAREAGDAKELIVTLNGEAVTNWGWFAASGAGADFSFGRRIEELARQIELSRTQKAELDEQFLQLQHREQELVAAAEHGAVLKQQLSELRKKLNESLQKERQQREFVQQEIRREEKRLREAALEREREVQQEVQRLASVASRTVSQVAFIRERIYVIKRELEECSSAHEQLNNRERELQARTEQQRLAVQQPNADLEHAAQQVSELDNTLSSIEATRGTIAMDHAELSQEVAELRRTYEAISRSINQASLAVERATMEFQLLRDEAMSAYGDSGVAVIDSVTQTDQQASIDVTRIDEIRESALALRKRLEREGEVDPDSIERYEAESARLVELQEQAADLQQAVSILERTIRRLKDLSRERFIETYKDVSRRFAELIPRLFGGGAGHMELVNPEDPLTSGVEISVRPPGKKLSSMELLSGGEKALVATAVLVAMFLHRPSPICVLDEVDAPLDEANLDRFISLVDEISSSTQFLVITHNKASMAAMGRLVGITMQERGVSTALTVTLDEAEEELDRWVATA